MEVAPHLPVELLFLFLPAHLGRFEALPFACLFEGSFHRVGLMLKMQEVLLSSAFRNSAR